VKLAQHAKQYRHFRRGMKIIICARGAALRVAITTLTAAATATQAFDKGGNGAGETVPHGFSFLAVQHALRMPGRTNQRDRNRA
jgi:hypothetical protein